MNGMVIFTGNSVGDTATYTCNLGFELIGSAFPACMQVDLNSAAFSPEAPVCRREYYVLPDILLPCTLYYFTLKGGFSVEARYSH